MSFFQIPNVYVKDSDGWPPPVPGVQLVKFGTFTFATPANTGLFFLPYGAIVTGWEIIVNTTFNAGTTNTLDVGLTGTPTNFAAAIPLTAANTVIINGFTNSALFAFQPQVTVVTVRYNQTGTAATTGSAVLACWYLIK